MPILSNPRRERFAQHVASAGNGASAYRLTYGAHGASAEVGASRLLRNDKVQRRVRELQGEAAKAAVMTLEEHRLFLAAVIRGEHADAKISDRVRAVEIDAKLAGHFDAKDGIPSREGLPPIVFNVPESFLARRGTGTNVFTEADHLEMIAMKRAANERMIARRDAQRAQANGSNGHGAG